MSLRIGWLGDSATVQMDPATDAACQWDGWGTALKPAVEDWWLFRKPLEKGLSVAANVLKWGVGGLNIAGCRIDFISETDKASAAPQRRATSTVGAIGVPDIGAGLPRHAFFSPVVTGRWPANLILDREAAELLDESTSSEPSRYFYTVLGTCAPIDDPDADFNRLYYSAKASRRERETGLEGMAPHTPGELTGRKDGAAGTAHPRAEAGRAISEKGGAISRVSARRNTHPT